MLNSTTGSDVERYALTSYRASTEERLPITEECRAGLSNLAIGLAGALLVAAVLFVAYLLLAI
ncbi:MAG: hypothetical protein KatS3mg053_3191 [Candidatus Roseilinea sp.]|jgi:hypothetical protein|nr:MAG: hypothetical protein KatS3mg053_3191 [Candidatus Roseilinea sp.]